MSIIACGRLCHHFQLKTYKRFWTDFLDNSLHHHHRKTNEAGLKACGPNHLIDSVGFTVLHHPFVCFPCRVPHYAALCTF